jgi:sporulation protein YlmC with PRC-barrel domain
MKRVLASLMVGTMAFGLAAAAFAADRAPIDKGRAEKVQNDKILVAHSFRASKLTGLNVRNREGEKLGTVNDLVVDLQTGKVSYIGLSVGGVLGVGDKLFAVPFDQVKFDHGQDEMFFVLDMTKEKLEAAPGFDQNNWPDFADPHWSERIDKYYRQARANAERDATK